MSGWDDTPAPAAEEGGFTADTWNSGSGAGPGFDDALGEENISKHAPADGGCRNCGADGHFARDCPEEKRNTGGCYNCGEEGHNKADCPNPRVEREFTGQCNLCGETGHRRADCPKKGPELCRACGKEGHTVAECSANRLFSAYKIDSEITAEQAWEALKNADGEKDVEEIKKSILTYAKAYPELTLYDLESSFRDANFNTYLIGKEQAIAVTHTIVNLEGKPDQKYVVSIQWAAKPRRAKFAEGWPTSVEDNMARLAHSGFVLDGFVTKCDNCNELGHTKAKCPEEKREPEKVVMQCVICNEEGHRARDCTAERPKPGGGRTCRNCGQEGHKASDCTEEPNLDLVECKNCSQMGHFSRDCPDREVRKCRNCDSPDHISKECPEPRNMSRVQCRNCDECGHTGKECPKPRDWSRVECSRCGEKGHGVKRCPQPEPEGDAGGDGGWGDSGAATSGGGGGDSGWGESGSGGGAASGGW